ncbi:MAG: DUF5009 domain-containing protein, partial [candidate division KSB1 bacterium]|nr:DUF5009 domain-containing protein [candidate division KSB1 bacterium]
MKVQRLLSLDLFRGMTMFLLVAEGTGLYEALHEAVPKGTFAAGIVHQFFHHPWNGLRFWDLIQPFFMFIVGVAMVFSLERRWAQGQSRAETTRHIITRCMTLFFLGVMLHCGYNRRLVWELWNVLTQLSFTILVAYLIYHLPARTQLVISLAMLGLSEFLYRIFWVPGFDQPFTPDHNFGSYMDLVLMGKLNHDHWIAINALPTAAHTIWGVLAGKLLRSNRSAKKKLQPLIVFGAVSLVVGYGLDFAGITSIIKRTATTSFVFASGGWCLLTLALFYWLVDVRGFKRGVLFFAVVGMNSIFIYLFSQTVGSQWFNGFVAIFSGGLFHFIGLSEPAIAV